MERDRNFETNPLGAMEYDLKYQNLTLGQEVALENEDYYRFVGQADRTFHLTSERRGETIVFRHIPRHFENDQLQVRFVRVYEGEPPFAQIQEGYLIGECESRRYKEEIIFHRENEEALHDGEEVDRISVQITLPREKFAPSFDSEIHVLILVK